MALCSTALGLALLLTACLPQAVPGNPDDGPVRPGTAAPEPDRRPGGSARGGPGVGPGDTAAGCVAPANAEVEDIDPEDSPAKPWFRPGGAELVGEFETAALSERYARFVAEAAAIWSESPCLHAVPVPACPAGANCVTVEEDDSRTRGTDGEMEWTGWGPYMESASITIYTRPL
ncbi:zinc metallopeptidase, partial [Arthrobacter deserti]|nr:zinc metallopeptidase [Arthrobacter deserti]